MNRNVFIHEIVLRLPEFAEKMINKIVVYLHTNELNTTFFCSTSPLKAPNHLKSLKLA
jgi:hypothetical protein